MNLAGYPKDKPELPAALNEFFYRSKTRPVQIEILVNNKKGKNHGSEH
jgi:hypothetical protein